MPSNWLSIACPTQFNSLGSLTHCHYVTLSSFSPYQQPGTGKQLYIVIIHECSRAQNTSLCEESCGCCGSVNDGGGLENLPSYASLSARIDKPLISSCSLCLSVWVVWFVGLLPVVMCAHFCAQTNFRFVAA